MITKTLVDQGKRPRVIRGFPFTENFKTYRWYLFGVIPIFQWTDTLKNDIWNT